MARSRYRRRRDDADNYTHRAVADRVYVARIVRDPSTQIDYTTYLAPSFRREVISGGVKPARKAAVLRGRIVKKRAGQVAGFKFVPGAAYLGDSVPSRRTLSDRNRKRVRTAELCKCKHERSEEQRRQSRKFFSGHGSRGLPKVQHVCHCA